jgi:hypothetical protein
MHDELTEQRRTAATAAALLRYSLQYNRTALNL